MTARTPPPFKAGDRIRVKPGRMFGGAAYTVCRCFRGLGGGWFADVTIGVTFACGNLELA